MEPNQTPYDLRFQILGTPVRVHPMFWLIAVLLGWGISQMGQEQQLLFLLAWVGTMFVSILVHEMGHVLANLMYGARSHVVLYGFGGLAVPHQHIYTWWKRVIISFAGPLAGFLLMALILFGVALATPGHLFIYLRMLTGILGLPLPLDEEWLAQLPMQPIPPIVNAIILFLLLQNFFWGLLNLLPIWPLDGGQISRAMLTRFVPDNGYRLSLGISFMVAGLFAINSLLVRFAGQGIPYLPAGGIWMALIFGLLAYQSFQLLQQGGHDPYDPWMGQRRPWER